VRCDEHIGIGVGMVSLPRSTGILLHVTSLPGGRLGTPAFEFVDWLAAAGQSWWQILPLAPPDRSGSPYTASSAFAAWPGLLAEPDAPVGDAELARFRTTHAYWIGDWERFAGPGAAADQVRFAREWSALRAYAAERGVRLIGDIPLYVGPRSADHRAHPELFQRGCVAGAPPDALSADGQLWGNPLYDWKALARTGFGWWIDRMRRTLELVDRFRIDHFRGFAAYWTVPAGAASALEGAWRPGPGRAMFDAARSALGELPVIAEDLGVITPDVVALRDALGFPGMAVTIWAFAKGADNPHRLENHRPNQVVYTSTHDTDTLAGTFGVAESWPLVELTLSSACTLAIVPAQDVLGLGTEARMNRPGTTTGNWSWRLGPGQLTDAHAARLHAAAVKSARL
jgi:4-alpha-glucanotransferase